MKKVIVFTSVIVIIALVCLFTTKQASAQYFGYSDKNVSIAIGAGSPMYPYRSFNQPTYIGGPHQWGRSFNQPGYSYYGYDSSHFVSPPIVAQPVVTRRVIVTQPPVVVVPPPPPPPVQRVIIIR